MRPNKILYLFLLMSFSLCLPSLARGAVRLKDISYFMGTTSNPLLGYGLVVGLNGTGDSQRTQFTVNSLANMLDNQGLHVDPSQINVKNVAAVMVTAKLPPFARVGSKLDLQVSSMGDATNLQGGTLLMTPLKAPDGKIYALAQGPLSTGGFSAGGGQGTTVQKNFPTVGFISSGATVERELHTDFAGQKRLELVLRTPDFNTVDRVVNAINQLLGGSYAHAQDAATVKLQIPPQFNHRVMKMVAQLEELKINPDVVAQVVIDERTGTVVIGQNVRILPVAVASGSLTVQISQQPKVSQPLPFSGGQTTVVPQSKVNVQESKAALNLVGGAVTIRQLVRGLNAIGATPRDLINILQAIKAAGALQAELKII